MTTYMIRIEGRGIDLVATDWLASALGFVGLGRRVRCTGFFATRYVESTTEAAAAQLARQQLTDELLEKGIVSMQGVAKLVLRIDEVAPAAAEGREARSQGFTFFER